MAYLMDREDLILLKIPRTGKYAWVDEKTKIAYHMVGGKLEKWFKIVRKVSNNEKR